jgi:hypothetical protein
MGGLAWPRIKFKFALNAGGNGLEFRKMPGWPEMFEDWPSTHADAFGLVLRLRSDKEHLAGLVDWRSPKDQHLIEVIMMLLPASIESAAEKAKRPPPEVEMWRAEATKLSTMYLQFMREHGLGTFSATVPSKVEPTASDATRGGDSLLAAMVKG